jgi:membrane associated rhomboid family serine protease
MSRRRKNRASDAGRPAKTNEPSAAEEFDAYGVTRTVFAFAGMGALMGLLVGGTLLGFPIAISTTIVGGIAGGVLGRYVKTDL